MRWALLLSLHALAAGAQTIPFETPAHVWFPPYGSVRDYETRNRSYGADLKRFAQENPAQMSAVCKALEQQPPADPQASQIDRYLRMNLDVSCASAKLELTNRPGISPLRKLIDDATAATSAIRERKPAQRALIAQIDQMEPGPERNAAIARAIVLRPQDARGAWYWMRSAGDLHVPPRAASNFIEELYRTNAQAAGRDALDWQSGFAEVLLYTGKAAEARRWATEHREKDDYSRMRDAILDELAGDNGAVPKALASCSDAAMCREVVWSIAVRTATILTAPPAELASIVDMTVPWYADDWPVRLETVRIVARLSTPLARKQLTAMYASRDIPDLAMLDAVVIDSNVSAAEHDDLRSVVLVDCWLKLLGVKESPLPADAWSRLAQMPEAEKETVTPHDCFDGSEPPKDKVVSADCVTMKLTKRLDFAAHAQQWDVARQTIERLLAHVLAHRLAPAVVRYALLQLAGSMKIAGLVAESQMIAKYINDQPHDQRAAFLLRENALLGTSTADVFEPWRSPVVVEAQLPRICD